MSFLVGRTKRLFGYGNLDSGGGGGGGTASASVVGGAMSVAIDSSNDGPSSGLISPTTGGKRRKRNVFLVAAAVAAVALVLVVSLAARNNKRAFVEAVSEVKRDSGAAQLLTQERQPRTGTDYDDGGGGGESVREKVKLEDTVYSKFLPTGFNGTWVSGNEIMYTDFRTGLQLLNIQTNEKRKIMSTLLLYKHFRSNGEKLSADKKFLLIAKPGVQIYRRSSVREYAIVPLKEGGGHGMTMIPLRPTSHTGNEPFKVRYAEFAPKGNAIVYVDYDNNIYYKPGVMEQDTKLTNTGKHPHTYNGVPDWVFEEEVFEDNKALWWSPEGTKLVWGFFNDSLLDSYVLPNYKAGDWEENLAQYPEYSKVPYPKVNRTNPTVELWFSDFDGPMGTKRVAPPESLMKDGGEAHFSRVTWPSDRHFAVQWMNRFQTKTVLTLCDTRSLSDCREIYHNKENDGWIEYKYEAHFDPRWNGSDIDSEDEDDVPSFVTILSDPHTRFRYRQVVLVSAGNQRSYLTNLDSSEVLKILRWSGEDNKVYFLATAKGQPNSQHLFRVAVDQTGSAPECMSCKHSDNENYKKLHNRECQYFDIVESLDGSHFVMSCQGPDVPYTCIHSTADNEIVSVWEDNSDLIKTIADVALPRVEFLEVPVPGQDLKVQARMYLPPDFDPASKYPMVVSVYGGPGSNNVNLKFQQHDYETYLAGSKGFVYVILDPVGTGRQGDKWRFGMYKGFGTVEVDSTIAATAWLQRNLSYVDADRTALWGWSYGGFLSLSALGRDEGDVFRCGASVAPVADWRLYDTYYTERYMGSLAENFKRYNESSPLWRLEPLRRKPYFLLHGTRDDNVHFQNSMLISAALEEADILFRQHAYPDEDHGIFSYHTHLYHSLTDFFLNDCFAERKTK